MIVYFKSKRGNFGDDLNHWLWQQLLPQTLLTAPDIHFLGIGTILFTKITENLAGKKIVFGSGYRQNSFYPPLDKSWEIMFLRGPISSYLLRRDVTSFITDSAYAISLTNYQLPAKKYPISFMPHYQSRNLLDFKNICEKLAIHYIDPCQKVEITLQEIAASEMMVAEAMHGAILADAFRVPWVRFRFYSQFFETPLVSEQKWADWLYSMELANRSVQTNQALNHLLPPRFIWRQFTKLLLLQKLRQTDILHKEVQLSRDDILRDKISQMDQQLTLLKNQYH